MPGKHGETRKHSHTQTDVSRVYPGSSPRVLPRPSTLSYQREKEVA